MSIIMQDASMALPTSDQRLLKEGNLGELLYADDTLLLSVSLASVSRFMATVSACGKRHGLELHWGKLQLLQVGFCARILDPNGQAIVPKASMAYLGAVVHTSGYESQNWCGQSGLQAA